MRVVLDTNVLVSAVVSPHGPSAHLVDLVTEGGLGLVVSEALLDELARVLRRKNFRRHLDAAAIPDLINALRLASVVHPDPPDVPSLTRDPKDDYLVALAVDAGVDALVSGEPSRPFAAEQSTIRPCGDSLRN